MMLLCAGLSVITGVALFLWLRGLAVIAGLRDEVDRLELRASACQSFHAEVV